MFHRTPVERIIRHVSPALTTMEIVQRQLVQLQLELDVIEMSDRPEQAWALRCKKWALIWRVTPERRRTLQIDYPRAQDDLMHEVMYATSFPKTAAAYLNLSWIATSGLLLGTLAFARALGGTSAAQRCVVSAALARWQQALEICWCRQITRLAESVDHDSSRFFRAVLQVDRDKRTYLHLALTSVADDHRVLTHWEASRLGISNAKVGTLVQTPERCVEGIDLDSFPVVLAPR